MDLINCGSALAVQIIMYIKTQIKRILETLAEVVLRAQHVQEMLRSAEPHTLLVGLQTSLQGSDLATPETGQDAGLQTVSPQ